MDMHNPAHPGEILKKLVIEPLGLSVTEAACHLGVSRKTLSKVLNGRGTVTQEMALRLEMTFGKPNAAHWLRLQNAYDLWQTRQRSADIHVSPVEQRPHFHTTPF
jgi:addiction module HigA family antidote